MRYLPILGELLSSDSVVFWLIGLCIAAVIGIAMKNARKCTVGFGICLAVYVLCEVVSDFRTNYLVELIVLFVGTVALGGAIGFLIGRITAKMRK